MSDDLADWVDGNAVRKGPGCGYCRNEDSRDATSKILAICIERGKRVPLRTIHAKVEELTGAGMSSSHFSNHAKKCFPDLYELYSALP